MVIGPAGADVETDRRSPSPGGLAGLSTWKNPPSKTTGTAAGSDAVCVCGSSGTESMFPAACCLAFMAAFTAARRDFAAALLPVGLAGAADGFWEREIGKFLEERRLGGVTQPNCSASVDALYLHQLLGSWR